MPRPQLPQDTIEAIKGAPTSESHEVVAARLGIAAVTVKKYRLAARRERQEIAREVVAQHVETNIPDALRDLTDLRRIARERFEGTGDPRHGQLWLGAIKTTLEHVMPDDADLDATIAAELERLADSQEATPLGAAARANRSRSGALATRN